MVLARAQSNGEKSCRCWSPGQCQAEDIRTQEILELLSGFRAGGSGKVELPQALSDGELHGCLIGAAQDDYMLSCADHPRRDRTM